MRLQHEQNCCSHCQARCEHRANKGSYNTGKRELNPVIAWQSFHCGIRHCHCRAQENCYLQRNLMPNKECSEELIKVLAWSTAAVPQWGLRRQNIIPTHSPYIYFWSKMWSSCHETEFAWERWKLKQCPTKGCPMSLVSRCALMPFGTFMWRDVLLISEPKDNFSKEDGVWHSPFHASLQGLLRIMRVLMLVLL